MSGTGTVQMPKGLGWGIGDRASMSPMPIKGGGATRFRNAHTHSDSTLGIHPN